MNWDDKLKILKNRKSELSNNKFFYHKCEVEFDYINMSKPKAYIFNKVYKMCN